MKNMTDINRIKAIITEATGMDCRAWVKKNDDNDITVARIYVGNGYAQIERDHVNISNVKSAQYTNVARDLEAANITIKKW